MLQPREYQQRCQAMTSMTMLHKILAFILLAGAILAGFDEVSNHVGEVHHGKGLRAASGQ